MEVEDIHTQTCNKFPRVGSGRNDSNKIGQKVGDHYPDDEDDGEALRRTGTGSIGGLTDANRLRGWHHSSRIIRVSRASGGKDRHSKVWTSKGSRDRRVRLSVTTAIQFYDLQDRLGYDQPSKAVEWLIKAAADAISELPSLNSANFPDTPKQLSDEKRMSKGTEQGFDSAEVEMDAEGNIQNQHLSLSKSASSTSETSKGSGLSLSRSEIRVNRSKARERARERAAKEKEKENESRITHHQNVNPISQNSSFTELLTGGIGNVSNNTTSPTGSGPQNHGGEPNLFHNYFSTGFLGASSSRPHNFSNSLSQTMSVPPLGENHPELQHFSFVPDHLIPVATSQPGGGNDYNLNFTISSSLAGFNRGTLQSNSPSLSPHYLQRYYSPIDGPNVPFFIGAAASAAPTVENHHHHSHHPHQFPAGFDGRLQLCYGDGSRHSDHKGKGKN